MPIEESGEDDWTLVLQMAINWGKLTLIKVVLENILVYRLTMANVHMSILHILRKRMM